MISDLFSSFDHLLNKFLSIHSSSMLMFICIINCLLLPLFFSQNYFFSFFLFLSNLWSSQFKNSKIFSLKKIFIFILSVFYIILLLNVFSLNSYMFPTSVHMIFSLVLAYLIWTSIMLSSMLNNSLKFFAHHVPMATPLWLSPMISLIEFMSSFVRPITLGFRLTANMMMGHIILALLSLSIMMSYFSNLKNFTTMIFLFFFLVFYFFFELMISGIQASVYSLLSGMYTNEHS